MSDNVPKDLCERRMIMAIHNVYVNISTELEEMLTEIFTFLSRRTLVQRVQPVNKVFKAICDKNVKSVHVIGYLGDFMWQENKLVQRRLEALAGNNCALAEHFRMTSIKINYGNKYQENFDVMRHSLDLFRHCQLVISPARNEFSEYFQAYLTLLEPAKPSYIVMLNTDTHLNELLRHPTTLNCPRLTVRLSGNIHARDDRDATFDWLHHRVDDMEEEHGEEVRCLNFLSNSVDQDKRFVQWLLEQNEQKFKESKVPEDRHSFVLTFYRREHENSLANFERKNPATGEVLLLKRVLRENGDRTKFYRLLRCSASRVANGTEQLFAKLFKYSFNFNLERAGKVARVEIF